MKTIDDFLVAMREDRELSDLITNSEALKRKYKPRVQGRTKSGMAASYLWDSYDGSMLSHLLERKYKVNLEDRRLIGKLKTALHLFIWGIMRE